MSSSRDEEKLARNCKKKKSTAEPFSHSQTTGLSIRPTSTGRMSKPGKRSMPAEDEDAIESQSRAKRQRNTPDIHQFLVIDEGDSLDFANSCAGIIKTVKLVNIMCHAHFEINFNPRMNFVTGVNGSGKSAIQTGLVVGLGGDVSKTNRGAKVHDLIKYGCNFGAVLIILSNCGVNAYKSEAFGNSIRIVRRLLPSSSSLKIFNQWGKLMSSNKKELDKILMQFRIQPNNSASILNQDMAKSFLSTQTAENKYVLFRKAMVLEEMEDLLIKVADEISEQKNRFKIKKRAAKEIEEEINKTSKKIKLIENVRTWKEKKFQLENELAWSKVNNHRNEVETLTSKRNEQISRKSDLQGLINNLEAEKKQLDNLRRKYEGDIAEMREKCNCKEDRKKQLFQEFLVYQKQVENKSVICDELELKLKMRKEDLFNLKKSLNDSKKMDLENEIREKQKSVALHQKFKLTEELSSHENRMKLLCGEMTRLKSTVDQFNEEISRHTRNIQNAKDHIIICQGRIQSFSEKSDSLSLYNTWMPTLVERIGEAVEGNKFSKPPRGPLGHYMKVKNEKWLYAIESHLQSDLLSSFLVNNGQDRRVLLEIMNHVIHSGYKPTIHCSSFQKQSRDHILPMLETTHPNYSNMLRALSISDVVVTNFLMDFRKIQCILLVENDNDCRNFVSNDENIPDKCKIVLNLEADQFLKGYRVYANQDCNRRNKLLHKSTTDQRRDLEEEVSEKQQYMLELSQKIESLQYTLNKCNERLQEISSETSKLKEKMIEIKSEMKELIADIEVEIPNLQVQINEMEAIEIEVNHLEEEKQTAIREREDVKARMLEAKDRMNKESEEEFFEQQTQLNMEEENVVRQLQNVKTTISVLEKKIDEHDREINILDGRLYEATNNLAIEENTASQLSPNEYLTQRSAADIKREIEKLSAFVREAQKTTNTDENVVETQYLDKKERLFSLVKTFEELKDLHKRMKEMYNERGELIVKLRDVNASIIMAKFQNVLQKRNYKGTLKFDHEKRKLNVLMTPIDGGDNLMDISSLSGGEKSYATVALLLALWSSMELPFYSMDEYDVFMDGINRKTITRLLINFAQENNSRQFIFLTPLDIGLFVVESANVKIHKVDKIEK